MTMSITYTQKYFFYSTHIYYWLYIITCENPQVNPDALFGREIPRFSHLLCGPHPCSVSLKVENVLQFHA